MKEILVNHYLQAWLAEYEMAYSEKQEQLCCPENWIEQYVRLQTRWRPFKPALHQENNIIALSPDIFNSLELITISQN